MDSMYTLVTIVNHTVWSIKIAKKVDLKSSYSKGEKL